MSDYASRIAELSKRILSIDAQVGDLNNQRNAASLPAVEGDTHALKQVARLDSQIETLLKERQTIAAASEQIDAMIAAEAAKIDQERKRLAMASARDHASAIMTLNREIDEQLLHLREMFERRQDLISGLARTEILSSSVTSKLSGRASATRAACAANLHKHLSLETCAPGSMVPLADSNAILLNVGKQRDGV